MVMAPFIWDFSYVQKGINIAGKEGIVYNLNVYFMKIRTKR